MTSDRVALGIHSVYGMWLTINAAQTERDVREVLYSREGCQCLERGAGGVSERIFSLGLSFERQSMWY